MVIDWEGARYTKTDKPLNAYDTLYKYYTNMEENILPILELMNINESNLPMDNDILECAKSLEKVTTKDIVEEITQYINILCNK